MISRFFLSVAMAGLLIVGILFLAPLFFGQSLSSDYSVESVAIEVDALLFLATGVTRYMGY